MNHLDVLRTYKEFKYVLYNTVEPRMQQEYIRVCNIIKNNGHSLHSDWDLTGGVMLENDREVIASIFYNTTKYKTALLINVAYVEPEYRRQGIYTELHNCVDLVAKQYNMEKIYSYIHANNRPMIDSVMSKIGYSTVMHLVSRETKKI